MGRLTRGLTHRNRFTTLKLWFLPILAACLLVFGAHIALAGADPTTEELATYLQSNQLSVGSETIDGYQQVYFTFGNDKIYLSEGTSNHTHPLASDEFITWLETTDGTVQLMMYNVLTKATLQLSSYGVNQNQVMQHDHVVWEQWQGDGWRIMYYDGFTVRQLSSTDTAVRAAIRGNDILYAQQDAVGAWRVLQYDTSTNQTQVIATGEETNAWPHFIGDEIKTNYPTLD